MFKMIKPEYIASYSYDTNFDEEQQGYKYSYDLKKVSDGSVILNETKIYRPRTRTIKTEFDLRHGVRDAIRMYIKYLLKINKRISFRCTNTSNSITRRSLLKPCFNTPCITKELQKQDKKLYSVIQIQGVWTIKKCTSELLTEEEAKTLLFKKIVNGED